MSVFRTTVIRTRVTARGTITRIGPDVPLPIRKEIGDLATGPRTSPDLPRNDDGDDEDNYYAAVANDDDNDDNDNDCYNPKHKPNFTKLIANVDFSTFRNLI
jgi:hypothetical protein